MSTRSQIAKQDPISGKITMIYCHSDGYLTHNGRILLEYYSDDRKVDELLALGDISFLAPEIGEKHSFDIPRGVDYGEFMKSPEGKQRESWVMAYGRDRGEKNTEAKVWGHLLAIPQDWYEEFFYLRKDGKWFYSDHGNFTSLLELTPEIVAAEVRAEAEQIAKWEAERKAKAGQR